MNKEIYQLPADTAKQFALAPGAPPVFENLKCGKIDIRTLTPAKAQRLIDAGCKHIVAIVPAAAPAPAPADKAKAATV